MSVAKIIEAAANKNTPPAVSPELERFQSYLGDRTHRFNGYARRNDHSKYYDPQNNPESLRMLACASVEWASFAEIVQDANMIYVPCGISSGLRAHEALDKHNATRKPTDEEWGKSTYKVSEYPGVASKHKEIMHLNRDDNLRRASIVGSNHPDSVIIAPVVREGAVRELTQTGGFTGWQSYEEEDFMAFWYPVIDKCKGMMLDGDWNYSRNSLWEMMRGVLIQAGEIPSRPEADMEVFDIEDKPVTLLARTEKVVEMLKYQLGKGFEPREAATVLAQIFTLDEDMRAHRIPAEGKKLHPILADRPLDELEAMDKIKAEFKPIILEHCAHLMRLDDLPQEYHDAAKAQPKELPSDLRETYKVFADNISANQLKLLSVKAPDKKYGESTYPPQRVFDSYERFFKKDSQATMFEDNLYAKLQLWERIAAPFVIGATETGLFPKEKPLATMVFFDRKRGKEGFKRAQAAGVQSMDELAGTMGRDIEEVIAHNTQEAEALKARLQKENPAEIVVNTMSFLRIAAVIDHFRSELSSTAPLGLSSRLVKAMGAPKTSPQLRLALQMKFLDRNAGRAVFQEGWEHSNDLVQLRVRARMIQAANIIDRPVGEQAGLFVSDFSDPNKKVNLLDDIKVLIKEVKRCADADVRAPEQALALARLTALCELVVDPKLQQTEIQTARMVINPLLADDSLTCIDRQEAQALIEEAQSILCEKAALWIPRERLEAQADASDKDDRAAGKLVQNDLMDDYLGAQEKLGGSDSVAKQLTRRDEIKVNAGGARQ